MMLVRDVDTTAQMMTIMTMVTMMTTMMTTMSDLVRLVWGIAALNRPLSAISRCKKIIIIAAIHFYLCVTITIIIVSIKPLSSWSHWQQWSLSSLPLPKVIDEKGKVAIASIVHWPPAPCQHYYNHHYHHYKATVFFITLTAMITVITTTTNSHRRKRQGGNCLNKSEATRPV